ncbi:MAG: hypothetical protein ACH6QQ_00660 [Candidatus Carsonella ruddii]
MKIIIYGLYKFKKYEQIFLLKINQNNNNFSIIKNTISYIGEINNICFKQNNKLIKINFLNAFFINEKKTIKIFCKYFVNIFFLI